MLLKLWLGHGCTDHRMLSKHERYSGLGMAALVTVCSRKHKRDYGLGMDALITVCSRNTNVSMAWAWMHWSPYALETRTSLWFGHGCSGKRRQTDMNDIAVWFGAGRSPNTYIL